MIKNGQFFDLGLPTTDYHRKNIIKQTIKELYDKFTLVLIYEYIDESLVLLKRRLCWEFDDILYLNFHHANQNTWNKKNMSSELKEKILQWNQADTQLYDFFNRSLWREIHYEGKEFWNDLHEFKKLRQETENDCLGSSPLHREQFFLNDDELQHTDFPTERNARIFLNTFKSNKRRLPARQGSGSGPDNTFEKPEYQSVSNNTSKISGALLTDETGDPSHDGSGDYFMDSISTTGRMLSSDASSWNTYFCKKLILNEHEYLDYFRRKNAYAKSMMSKHRTQL